MAYKRIKDESKLIAKYKIFAGKRYYFHIFLWEDQKSFDSNTLDCNPGTASGCTNLSPTIIEFSESGEREIIRPKLGEIHFIKDRWSLETVSHELCHALIQRLRMIQPTAQQIIEQEKDYEEDICYEFGRWVDQVYRLLWKDNILVDKL